MSDVQFLKADINDMDDILDFGNFVFSQSSRPHNFLELLPKLYKPEYFMDGIHYLAKEDGKIKALVGSYPMKLDFYDGTSLPGRGIGMVSVHMRSRSKGYMNTLMNMALEDMRKDRIVFSCLGGRRQRYEYFGYTPTGINYMFEVSESNIYHTLGKEWKTGLRLQIVKPDDKDILDGIMALHNEKKARYFRDRAGLYDILSSWESKTFAVMEGDRFEGYLVCNSGFSEITEINMKDNSRLCEAIGIFLKSRKEAAGQKTAAIWAGPLETEKVTVLSEFADNHSVQNTAYQFNILDWKRFTGPFINLRSQTRTILDGVFVLKIEGPSGGTFALESKGGKAGISETASAPDLVLNHLGAMEFLFNPFSAVKYPAIGKHVFLQSLLPLPLFFETLDAI
jgi:predicted N-acetyltransferase YhbS